PEPRHPIEDDPHGLVRGALTVRVLDAQDELAAHAVGIEPAIEGGPDTSHVEHAGGARGKSGDYGHGRSEPSWGRDQGPRMVARADGLRFAPFGSDRVPARNQ